jgi:hypothetical protein
VAHISLKRHMGNWKSELRRGRLVLAFLSVAFVLTLTHLPPDAIPEALPRVLQAGGSDKIEHALASVNDTHRAKSVS